MKTKTAFVLVMILAAVASAAQAPQFRGLNRDGKFDETGLMKAWPDGGPPLLWVADGLGEGYSSVSVVGDKIYTSGANKDLTSQFVVLNTNGEIEMTIPYGKEADCAHARGPRATPTIVGDRAYLMSAHGVVYCIDMEKGEVVWEADILKRFGAKNIRWHLAESLLVDGDNVICTPGGRTPIAALNRHTGETVWTTSGFEDATSYCSPDIIVHNGRRILLTETAKLVVAVDPDSGELLWAHPHETRYDIHAVTPVYSDGLVYYTGGYGSGGGVLELSEDGTSVTERYTDKNLDCQHHGVVLVDGYLYGSGHNNPGLMCIEMATGKLMWRERDIRQGAVVYADGMLYAYDGPRAGNVSLVKATPEGFERTGMFKVEEGDGSHWTHPVVANGRLYIRRGNALMAYDVREQ